MSVFPSASQAGGAWGSDIIEQGLASLTTNAAKQQWDILSGMYKQHAFKSLQLVGKKRYYSTSAADIIPPLKILFPSSWIKRMKSLFFAIIALFCTASTAFADICEGVALSNFKDEAGHHVQKGEIISSLHSDKFDHKGNPKTYAQYMGFVWSAKKVKLTNCHLEKSVKNGKIISKLVLNNTPDNQNEIKYQKTRKFLEAETALCMAETGNAAYAYVYNPTSKLGRITASFLKGRSKNKNFPEPKWPEGAIYGKDD